MRILHLTLKKKWFDMIASGEKPEEYRELKPYWMARLVEKGYWEFHPSKTVDLSELRQPYGEGILWDAIKRHYDYIHFTDGYNRPRSMNVKFDGVSISTGKPEWGAEPGKEYFVIKLGEIIK